MMALADAFLAAWWVGSVWGMATTAGVILGLLVSIAWTLRHYAGGVSIGLVLAAAAMTAMLAHTSPRAGVLSLLVALAVFGVWFVFYDLWFTGRANAEVVSPVTTAGGDGRAGRALIVHHQGRGPQHFQQRMQLAFAEGLQSQGWRVDITTASREAPTDVSAYDLLVLGAQAYNWCPARAVVDYVDRLYDLRGKSVVVVVSGGGMTERAMRVLQAHVLRAGGAIVDAIEIWQSRPNAERHGLSDPVAVMRRAGARQSGAPHRHTA
jgi:flavodoxin